MEITSTQVEQIADCLPMQLSSVRIGNLPDGCEAIAISRADGLLLEISTEETIRIGQGGRMSKML